MRSYALDAGDSLVLFDPLVSAAEVDEVAAARPLVVVLTCRWHTRSSAELVKRIGATVHAPADKAEEIGLPVVPYRLGDDLPLTELPVELLLPTHGDPIIADAGAVLEKALAQQE